MTYQLIWKQIRDEYPLPLVTREQQLRDAAPGIIWETPGIVTIDSVTLERVEQRDGYELLHYRVVVEDVDAPEFERVMRDWPPLIELTLLAHEVSERPAAPVANVTLEDGRVADMFADPRTGDMMETKEVWRINKS